MACRFSSISFSRSSPFNLNARTLQVVSICIDCTYFDTKRPPFGTPLLKFLWFFEESAVPSSTFHIPSSSTGWFALEMMEDSLGDLDDDDTDLDHNIRAEVTTPMMRSLPLPGQNTNTTTLAHPLESSLSLLHFIVNSVQTLLNVIKLLCNHQMGL